MSQKEKKWTKSTCRFEPTYKICINPPLCVCVCVWKIPIHNRRTWGGMCIFCMNIQYLQHWLPSSAKLYAGGGGGGGGDIFGVEILWASIHKSLMVYGTDKNCSFCELLCWAFHFIFFWSLGWLGHNNGIFSRVVRSQETSKL